MIQLVTKVDDELAAAIDDLVSSGRYRSRSDVVRRGLTALVDGERRAAVGARILDGYERVPETPDELAQADAMARAMIAEEPW